ncbi:hypothetical protein [Mycolicibacterium poriferae]|uniref:hypothetical protein n=1 Tax=Mycolicibacterium poriferae TaxID=39694 RepID=UPI0024B89A27|nr:hypothetical protein [Mycolicibacterium poriferae]
MSYATTCERERDVGHAFSDVEASADDANGHPLIGDRWWNRQLEAASSLCEGGQWAMLIDPSRALGLWRRAGQLYREVGFGFGYCLSVMTSDVEPSSDEARTLTGTVAVLGSQAARLLDRRPRTGFIYGDEQGRPFVPPVTEEMQYPQQQGYWLLAAVAFAARYGVEVLMPSVADLLEHSPNRFGADPVGALGIPVRTLWRVSNALTQPPESGVPMLAATLGDLARRYEESIGPAMENSYLWQNCAAPVDVGNIDVAVLTLSGHLVFGDVFRNALLAEMERLSDVAGAQLDIALDLATEKN